MDDPVLFNDWHAVALEREMPLRTPRAVRLLGEDVVIWRTGAQMLAWQDLCVHRGTRLSLGRVHPDDTLECPYHGWTYDVNGRCTRLPAHPRQAPPSGARVKTYQAVVESGLVWVALGNPQGSPPLFPEWSDNAYRKIACGPYEVNASAPRIVENFLDIAHFPFVHEGVLGARERPEIEDYEAQIDESGVIAHSVRVFQPDPYGTGVGDTVAYTYRVPRPFVAYLAKESDGPRFSIFLAVAPHDSVRSTAWMWMAMNYGYDLPEQGLVEWQDGIFAQDQPILQSQRPELLPLDLQAELHLRSDRLAIAYRRWLRALGLSFGTA